MHGEVCIGDAVNWEHPLLRGIKGWWMCLPGQSRGSIWRDLTRRVDGSLTNMDPATDWVGPRGAPGQFGGLDFDGGNDYVNLNSFTAITVDTLSFSSLYVLRKTDSSTGGTKIVNPAAASVPGGFAGYLGWTDSAGRGWEAGVPALGGSSNSVNGIEVSGTPHTTFDNNLHIVSFDYPGGNTSTTPSLVQWVIDGVQYDGAAGTTGGAANNYWLGGRGSTAGWPGIIHCHMAWVPAIGPEKLKEVRRQILTGYPDLLNWTRSPRVSPVVAVGGVSVPLLTLLGVG